MGETEGSVDRPGNCPLVWPVVCLTLSPLTPPSPSPGPSEEEWKRLQALAADSGRYNQIGFSYGAAPAGGGAAPESAAAAATATAGDPAVDDEPYQPPPALNVPADMAQVRPSDDVDGLILLGYSLCVDSHICQ